jgi:hypothetical protein
MPDMLSLESNTEAIMHLFGMRLVRRGLIRCDLHWWDLVHCGLGRVLGSTRRLLRFPRGQLPRILRHCGNAFHGDLRIVLRRIPSLSGDSTCKKKKELATSEWTRQLVRSFTSSLSQWVLRETAQRISDAFLQLVDVLLLGIGDLVDLTWGGEVSGVLERHLVFFIGTYLWPCRTPCSRPWCSVRYAPSCV